jgi:hypothetical protein
MSRSYTSSPPWRLHGGRGIPLLVLCYSYWCLLVRCFAVGKHTNEGTELDYIIVVIIITLVIVCFIYKVEG